MIFKIRLLFLFLIVLMAGSPANSSSLKLVDYDEGFFKIKIPSGWKIYTAGQCAEFAFVARNNRDPLSQIFFFGAVGPVYMNQQ